MWEAAPWSGEKWVCWRWRWRLRRCTVWAASLGKRALALCSISDHLLTGEDLPPAERETTFTTMMEIALETAVRMEDR